MRLGPYIYIMRGATAYEFQVWRVLLRIVHLSGAYWRWRPWRRVSVTYHPEDF
jgi:hypothetical protein